MRTLTPQEKRTLRVAAVLISVYLALFFGWRGWEHLEGRRTEYQKVWKEASSLTQDVRRYENKVLLLEKLTQTFQIAPEKLSNRTLVADASEAIHKAAASGGVQLGPIRETAARPSARELASMQLEGTGSVPAVMAFLQRISTLGYPLILDSMHVTPDPKKPGSIKVNLTLIILDFEQWKSEEPRHA